MRRPALVAWLCLSVFFVSVFLPAPSALAKARKKARKAKPAVVANFDTKLPVLGTHLTDFPPGAAKSIADHACLSCHSADMVWQQQLTEKQWTAGVNKMIGWGSEVPEDKKQALIAYLVANFGPGNNKFQPVITRPVGR